MPVDHSASLGHRLRRAPRHHYDTARRYAEHHPTRITAVFLVGFAMFAAVGYLAPRVHLNPDEISTPDFPAAGATALALAAAVAVDLLLLVAFALHDRAAGRGAYDIRDSDPAALIPPVLRPFLWLVLLPSLTGLAVLASRVADRTGPLAVDRRVDEPLVYRFHPIAPVFRGLTQLGSPAGIAVLSVLLAALSLAVGHRRAALLALACPPLAGALTEYALKPFIGRRAGRLYAFPSGHTTGAVAVAVVITLLLLPAGAFTRVPHPLRLLLTLMAVVLASAVPLGLVVLRYHYATDVLAGAAVALATTLTLALTLDTAARRLTRHDRPGPSPDHHPASQTAKRQEAAAHGRAGPPSTGQRQRR
ncbi:MAG: phosphatase PAP2 family protein [Frankia sp.]